MMHSRAADEVLWALYPNQATTFDASLAENLAAVTGPRRRAQGEAVGRQVGEAILALRADDGSAATVDASSSNRT